MKKNFLTLFLFLLAHLTRAQLFPVEITANPFLQSRGSFDHLSNELSQQGAFSILLLDNTVPTYEIMLDITLSGWGIHLQSNQTGSALISLTPSVPYNLQYTNWENLLAENGIQVSGHNSSSLFQSGFFPPGNYELCIKARDAIHPDRPIVSNILCITISVNSEPSPECMFPFCGDTLFPQLPLDFQWSDLSSAPQMEYTLQIYERRFPDLPMISEINQTAPLFEHSGWELNYTYSITDPPLQQGRTYIWRIKKRNISGQYQLDNGGYSMPCSFIYGKDPFLSNSTLELNGVVINPRQIRYQWNLVGNYHHYEFQIRSGNSSHWNSYTQNSSIRNEYNLEPSTNYVARVRGCIGQEQGVWSNEVSLTTSASMLIGCNDDFIIPPSPNYNPLENLHAGDRVDAGQFEITTISAAYQGIPGKFSGLGQTILFGFLALPVEFNQASFSDERKLVSGSIHAKTTTLFANNPANNADPWQFNHYQFAGSIDTILTGPEGLIFIIDSNGDTTQTSFNYTAGNTVITDQNGFSWLILENGTVVYLSPSILQIIQGALESELEENDQARVDLLSNELELREQDLQVTISRLSVPPEQTQNLSLIAHWEEAHDIEAPKGKNTYKEKENQYNYSLFSNRFSTKHLCPDGLVFLAQWLEIEGQNAAYFINEELKKRSDEEELIRLTKDGLNNFLRGIILGQ